MSRAEGGRLREEEVREIAERLDALLEALARNAAPEAAAAVAEIVDGLQRVHAEGLRRLVELVAEDRPLFQRALDDPVISNLLLLYDLVVVDERERAREALETIRPLARSHGGEIQLVEVEEGVVRVRLHGACHGCPSSTATLRQGIERALSERLPGFVRLEVAREAASTFESIVPRENLVRMERRAARARHATEGTGNGAASGSRPPGRMGVAPLDEIPREGLSGHLVEGYAVLLVTREAEDAEAPRIRAFRNACPGSLLPLHLGELEGGEIRCPWHGCRFDPETGNRRGGDGPPLESLEITLEDGCIWVEATP